MKDEIYERNYRSTDTSERERKIYNAMNVISDTGIFDSINKRLNSLPHVIVPEKKRFYRECLQLLDGMAKRMGGTIKGIVSYQEYDAQISIVLPFFEFSFKEDMEILKHMAKAARAVSIYHENDNMIRLVVYIDYFEAMGDVEKIINEEFEKLPLIIEEISKKHGYETD